MSYRAIDDSELLEGIRRNEESAFRLFVQRYEHDIATIIIGMLGNTPEADDIGQETFIRFFQSVDRFRGDSSIKTYLTRIAMNLALNEIKRRQRFKSRFLFFDGEEADLPFISDDDPMTIENRERDRQVQKAINALKPEYKAVVILRMIQGYDTRETSEILNIPIGTVLSRFSRAMSKLKTLLKPYYETDECKS